LHCEIRFDSNAARFEIKDLGSRNGTFVASGAAAPRRLAPHAAEPIAPGQRVLIGSSKNCLVVELG
jgi:pSer/pThr/pTyr-binding forkhead associated (FHA) protein